MDLSANLISLSLSDSGFGAPTSFSSGSAPASNNGEGGSTQSSSSGDPFESAQSSTSGGDPFEPAQSSGDSFEPAEAPGVNNCNTEVGGCGLLIDWGDEIQVPVPQAILTQAEVDDTFGVFSYAQKSSQLALLAAAKVSSLLSANNDEDTAAKLVRSFTSGRKSDPKVATSQKQSDDIEPPSSEPDNNVKEKIGDETRNNNDSAGSSTSDQPTIIEDDILPHLTADDLPDGSATCDVKTDQSRNASTGSDSELMDVNNLSSFSFPDGDMDEIEFIRDIQREDMAGPFVTSAIVNKIKREMLQDEYNSDEVCIPSLTGDHLSDITCPTLNSTTATTRSNRLSSCSSISSVSTVCGSRLHARLSSASTISDHSIMGSPIRASYPFTKYMPTPNGRTPIREHISRDRLSESLSSPTRTRVFLETGGGAQKSPSRMPVRKSISAETLHFQQSPSRVCRREQVKFSTPTAQRGRSRYSINVTQEDNPPVPLERNVTFVSNNVNVGPVGDYVNPSNVTHTVTEAEKWKIPRLDRVSFSSTSSCGSSVAMSPTSTFIKREREISLLSKQMLKVNIRQPAGFTAAKGGREGLAVAGVQPLRATAVVPPTSLNSEEATSTSNTKPNPFRTKPKPNTSAAITSSGQRKFVPPVAASSPKLGPSPARPTANQITPSRSRYTSNARSSGYGQQNLNATFEAKEPLKSPNTVTGQPTAPKATVKPPALPKSLKGGLPPLGTKIRPTASAKAGEASTKIGSQVGFLRRPTATAVTGGASTSVNKENNARAVPRYGFPSRPRQQ